MDKIKDRVRVWFRKFLGIGDDVLFLQRQITKLRTDFDAQMSMVGVDVHMRRDSQSKIIFISNLGRSGEGTVKIMSADFRNFVELMDFINYCDRSFGEKRVVIDPPYMGHGIIEEERKRRR